jgi:hypothetical protein
MFPVRARSGLHLDDRDEDSSFPVTGRIGNDRLQRSGIVVPDLFLADLRAAILAPVRNRLVTRKHISPPRICPRSKGCRSPGCADDCLALHHPLWALPEPERRSASRRQSGKACVSNPAHSRKCRMTEFLELISPLLGTFRSGSAYRYAAASSIKSRDVGPPVM